MLRTVAILCALIALGYCVYVRRTTWRIRPDWAVTQGCALQVAGFILCMPIQSKYLGRWLLHLTGMPHLRDFVGHLCFIAGVSSIIYTIACRLVSKQAVEVLMRWIELPSAIAGMCMLVFFTMSGSARCPGDFFQVPCDSWLRAYWVTYCAIMLWLLNCATKLLMLLRSDAESKVTAELFIVAALCAAAGVGARIVTVVTGLPADLHGAVTWIATCTAGSVVALAASQSWRARTQLWPDEPPQSIAQ